MINDMNGDLGNKHVVCFYPRLRAVQMERTAVLKATPAVTSCVRKKAPG